MNDLRSIAALFVLPNSIYKTLPGVECYDEDRDALTFPGGMPVVAHPPCRLWGRLRHMSKADPAEKKLAIWALNEVRQCGGVLEHPAGSMLWKEAHLPSPNGRYVDLLGGWSMTVDQFHWGHRARKRTWLYICGIRPCEMPRSPLRMGDPSHVVNSSLRGSRALPECGKRERSATPSAFAEWLVEIARRTHQSAAARPT